MLSQLALCYHHYKLDWNFEIIFTQKNSGAPFLQSVTRQAQQYRPAFKILKRLKLSGFFAIEINQHKSRGLKDVRNCTFQMPSP